MKNRRSKYVLTLVLIVGIVGLVSQSTVAASIQPTPLESHSQHSWTGNTWSHTWSQHTSQQVTVTIVSTASNQRHGGWSNGGGYYGGNYYGQYNQNPYYNPYCPAGSSYCSQYPYYQNPNAQNCPVYNNQNPACYPYNYSPNYCVNSPYCSPYTASQYPYATTTQQFTPQVIIQNITVTQSVTATPTPTTQVTLAAPTEANTDQTAQYYLPLIATSVALSTIAAIAVLLFTSRRSRAPGQPSQAVTSQQFTPQRADKKFCHRCGSGLGSDSLYCTSCGTRVI